ncbi:MAG: restriction endonuclease subunit S, partial [Waterburya sp.]
WNKFVPLENKALPQSLKPKPELCVEEGDVLVTRAGPRKRVGVVAAVRKSNSRLMISDKIIRLKPDEKKINPLFLEISLASSFSQNYLFYKKTGLADAQVNISQTILRSTPITYPCLEEQQKIIDYLDRLQSKVDEMKRLREKALQELDAFLPSILDQAFKGEL